MGVILQPAGRYHTFLLIKQDLCGFVSVAAAAAAAQLAVTVMQACYNLLSSGA